jgi:hypothetical protein
MSGAQRGCALVHCSLHALSLTPIRSLKTPQTAIKEAKRSKRARERRVNSEQVNNVGGAE